jgi:hypothetical protein
MTHVASDRRPMSNDRSAARITRRRLAKGSLAAVADAEEVQRFLRRHRRARRVPAQGCLTPSLEARGLRGQELGRNQCVAPTSRHILTQLLLSQVCQLVLEGLNLEKAGCDPEVNVNLLEEGTRQCFLEPPVRPNPHSPPFSAIPSLKQLGAVDLQCLRNLMFMRPSCLLL